MIHARLDENSTMILCGARRAQYSLSWNDTLALPGRNDEATCPDCLQIIAADVARRLNSPKPGIAFHADAFTLTAAEIPWPPKP